jgi:hypothetical protein
VNDDGAVAVETTGQSLEASLEGAIVLLGSYRERRARRQRRRWNARRRTPVEAELPDRATREPTTRSRGGRTDTSFDRRPACLAIESLSRGDVRPRVRTERSEGRPAFRARATVKLLHDGSSHVVPSLHRIRITH